jgi:hypothetical protein
MALEAAFDRMTWFASGDPRCKKWILFLSFDRPADPQAYENHWILHLVGESRGPGTGRKTFEKDDSDFAGLIFPPEKFQ